ncbi:MAG: DUF4492 domain-containing protein [Bacteroidetes bacterium]|uniref:DUF4492 domain-containing protein n=1 Tax=Candidatus Cryptobacteroides intestinigallinarum TaxID=2840767 RepID=A0A9D9HLF6_9BACT|nr:DUF4492 domain-containing protein [Candidatus Cryptobacteroides intestinigallinarum]
MWVLRKLTSVWRFYADGFRNMTWGRPLWILIILKLVILFAILRVFFFQPVLAGKSDEQKSDFVGEELINHMTDNTDD